MDGTPVLLDQRMCPVESVSAWFRHLALMGQSAKTMRKYAYVALRLSEFLAQTGTDVVSATETDLLEYRARGHRPGAPRTTRHPHPSSLKPAERFLAMPETSRPRRHANLVRRRCHAARRLPVPAPAAARCRAGKQAL
uniref:site-specific integrase n=1 Tax=Amycolatopsis sp. CA-096443 TaxID=3239919 RepID=UPI003F496C9D